MSKLRYLVSVALLTISLVCAKTTTAKTTIKTTPSPDPKESRDANEIDYTSIMNECNETFRTEMSYIDALNKSGSFPDESDKTPKCFVRCILEKSNVVSEDGVFEPEQALAFFSMERPTAILDNLRETTDACINRNETCMCERSYQFLKCVVEMEINKFDVF
ncbi:general odorant-binding protein 84a-like [Epargyreus clarus]|uniref:general odorant-binding protein 84a-like n=1 Tax=Epargyreus clarus TaxID=520877 RepID=UPI003C2CAA21